VGVYWLVARESGLIIRRNQAEVCNVIVEKKERE